MESAGGRAACVKLARVSGSRHVATLLVLVLAGCGMDAPPEATPVDVSGTWQLEVGVVNGQPLPLVPGHDITLTIEPTRVGGVAACNHYGAGLVTDGHSFRVAEPLEMTAMGCEPAVMASESAYVEALARVRQVTVDGDRLVLSGPATSLRFARLRALRPYEIARDGAV
jgi:heat shock protein HslJ